MTTTQHPAAAADLPEAPAAAPEPLRLAALMDAMDYADTRAAAAELRRLHAALSAAAPAAPADAIRNNAAEVEPMFWVRLRSDGGYEGPLHKDLIEHTRKLSGAWYPLHLGAAPQAQQPTAPQEGAPAYDVAGVLHGLYEAANREAPGPTLRAITNAIQHLQAAQPQAGAESYPPSDKGTPGVWFVRKKEKDGVLVDCWVSAPDCNGFAYDAEILGDDEYRDDEGVAPGLSRKLADCELIVTAVNALRARGAVPQAQRHAAAEVAPSNDCRAEFETWAKFDTAGVTFDRGAYDQYNDFTAALLWHAWGACWPVAQDAARAGAQAVPSAHITAMERAWHWMDSQADQQSKGGHATFDLMMLRQERDALRAAIDALHTACERCGGTGEVHIHSHDCSDDLCALNGDQHSCAGNVEPCQCTATPAAVSAPSVPEGWKLVPVQMTDEMRDAGNVHTLSRSTLVKAWSDMLAAAPQAPAGEGGAA